MIRPFARRAGLLAVATLAAGCAAEDAGDLAGRALAAAIRSRCALDDRCVDRGSIETMEARRSGPTDRRGAAAAP